MFKQYAVKRSAVEGVKDGLQVFTNPKWNLNASISID